MLQNKKLYCVQIAISPVPIVNKTKDTTLKYCHCIGYTFWANQEASNALIEKPNITAIPNRPSQVWAPKLKFLLPLSECYQEQNTD